MLTAEEKKVTKSVHLLLVLFLDGAAGCRSVKDSPIAREYLRISEMACI